MNYDIYSEHVANLPEIKTPITDDCKNDLLRMIELEEVIDFVMKHGTESFNKPYAEKLCHLLLIGKLEIAEPKNYIDCKKSFSGRVIDVLRLYNDGYYVRVHPDRKDLTRTTPAVIQSVFDLVRADKNENIYIINLIEVLTIHYNALISSGILFKVRYNNNAGRETYFKQQLDLMLECLKVAKDYENKVYIVLNDCEADDCKKMQERFIDSFFTAFCLGKGKPNLVFKTENIKTNYYREFDEITFIEPSAIDTSILSYVKLDFNKLSTYNSSTESTESILKELYIDAQGLNQIKKNLIPDSNKSLKVKVYNVPRSFKDIVSRVLQEETKRLRSAYADKFIYEIEYKE